MLKPISIARDDRLYCAWPDVVEIAGRLICVFAACTHHGNRDFTVIRCCFSDDDGQTWSAPQDITGETRGDPASIPYWNCPRITSLADGRCVVVVDKTIQDGGSIAENYLLESRDRGQTWSEPRLIPVVGIVPDQLVVLAYGPHAGRWIIGAHQRVVYGRVRSHQRVWLSDDQGATWQGPHLVAASSELFLCEGSVMQVPSGEVVCFMRENSMTGRDAYKSISFDAGLTWTPPVAFPLPGCHRPVAGMLSDGQAFITFRLCQGGNGWAGWWMQNTCGGFTDISSCLATDRQQAHTRIVPIDYDRSSKSDGGYTGWVERADGKIFIVNYCVDDWPRGQIRGYYLRREDVMLP